MARAVPQVVRKYEQVTYEREVLGNEPVKEHREPKLIDTKIDVNFYLTEEEAQHLYTALEMGIDAMGKEVRNYGTHRSMVLPGREPISSTADWDGAFKAGKSLADILFDALITAVEHRTVDEEPEEPKKIPEDLILSELPFRLLEYYAGHLGLGGNSKNGREFLIREAAFGRTFIEDHVEEAETELESLGFLQWEVVPNTPEGLILKVTDAGRVFLKASKANTVKSFAPIKWRNYDTNLLGVGRPAHKDSCTVQANHHLPHCEAVNKCDAKACTCAEAFPERNVVKWKDHTECFEGGGCFKLTPEQEKAAVHDDK